MTLSDWSDLAQVVATVIGLVGVVVSLWLSTRTLREVEADRRLRHRPFIAFEPGGHVMHIEFVKRGALLAGVNPAFARLHLGHLPSDGESVALVWNREVPRSGKYGRLRNYGVGPALEVEVQWVAERVRVGSETFEVTPEKQNEILYSRELNMMPTMPSHVEPNASAKLTRLPAFIVKDYEKKLTRIDGHFVITCRDVLGVEHETVQEFVLFTEYRNAPPTVSVTFSDIRGAATKR